MRQSRRLVAALGEARVTVYPAGGHLLPISEDGLWEDVTRFLGDGYR
jgi:hypothetical protein